MEEVEEVAYLSSSFLPCLVDQVRGRWLAGPLSLIIDYRAAQSGRGVTRVRTGLMMVQLDSLTSVDRFGAQMTNFNVVRWVFTAASLTG